MPPPRARARPQDHPEPLGGMRVPLAAQGGRAQADGRLQRGHRLSSAPRPGPPGLRTARRLHFQSGHSSFLPPAAGCLCLPGAAQNGRRSPPPFCVRPAGRRPGGGGGRETTVRPLPRVAWTEPSSSPRPSSALAAAALGLAPAHVLARPSGNPGPSPSPAGPLAAPQPSLTSRRRCCEAEPRRAVIKAMLLEGVLGIPGAGTDSSRNDSRLSGRGGGGGLPRLAATGPGLF